MGARAHANAHACTHGCMHAVTHACTHACECSRTHAHTHAHTLQQEAAQAQGAKTRPMPQTYSRPSAVATGTLMPSAEWFPAWMKYRSRESNHVFWTDKFNRNSLDILRGCRLWWHACIGRMNPHVQRAGSAATRMHARVQARSSPCMCARDPSPACWQACTSCPRASARAMHPSTYVPAPSLSSCTPHTRSRGEALDGVLYRLVPGHAVPVLRGAAGAALLPSHGLAAPDVCGLRRSQGGRALA